MMVMHVWKRLVLDLEQLKRLARYPSESLLGAGDDRILKAPGEVDEVGAVPRHPDYQVLILLRFFLRLQEGLPIDHVELDVADPQVTPGTQVIHESLLGDQRQLEFPAAGA